MQYSITQQQLNYINMLIRTIELAIQRKAFQEEEIIKIYNIIEELTKKN
tara:strand:+ start:962 stop:1108 length:147 start_codon:yes stop_codon:yes gene_type:complete